MSQDFKRVRPFDDFPPLEVAAGDTRVPTFVPDGSITDAQIAPGISPTKIALEGIKFYRSTTQTIGTAADTAITFDTVVFNRGFQNPGASFTTVTIPRNGIYVIVADMTWDNDSTGGRTLRMMVNGTQINEATMQANGTSGNSLSAIRRLTSGDTLGIQVRQSSGVNRTIAGTENTGGVGVIFMGTI